MIEFRKVLIAYLKSIHPSVVIDGKSCSRVHFQVAPEVTSFPYLVYDLPNALPDGEYKDKVIIDIDGWDINSDTSVLESLMASVNGNGDLVNPTGLDKSTLNTGTVVARFSLENKISLLDDDPRIRRRKYIYQARLFKRG